MAKSEILREYHMSYGELKQLSDLLVLNITRDLADFTPRGFSSNTLLPSKAATHCTYQWKW